MPVPPKATSSDTLPLARTFELMLGAGTGAGEERAYECPRCGKEKLCANVKSGVFKCQAGSCQFKGSLSDLIEEFHAQCLSTTADHHYQSLRATWDLAVQTIKRFGLAWWVAGGCWLVPAKSDAGKILSLTRFNPATRQKLVFPGLKQQLLGCDQYPADRALHVFLLEGMSDLFAFDSYLRERKVRGRYGVLSLPSATIFLPKWAHYFDGRHLTIFADNDKAGRDGADRVVRVLREAKIKADVGIVRWPQDYPDKYDVRDLIRRGDINVVDFARQHREKVFLAEKRLKLTSLASVPTVEVPFLMKDLIPGGSLVTVSGDMGTNKSGILGDFIARVTVGAPLPGHDQDQDPPRVRGPANCLLFTAEDSASRQRDRIRLHGGDLDRVRVHDLTEPDSFVDLTECWDELEAAIVEFDAKLVGIDPFNSFFTGDISTDSKARKTLTSRLHGIARRTGACIMILLNWGRSDAVAASHRALGAKSLTDVARCVMNTRLLPRDPQGEKDQPPRFALEFEKVSDARKPRPLIFTVENLAKCEATSHHRRIQSLQHVDPEDFKASMTKGSAKR